MIILSYIYNYIICEGPQEVTSHRSINSCFGPATCRAVLLSCTWNDWIFNSFGERRLQQDRESRGKINHTHKINRKENIQMSQSGQSPT